MTTERTTGRPQPHFPTAADVLSGETADVYFDRARTVLAAEGIDPVVTIEIFSRGSGILCGAEESLAYLREIFSEANGDGEPIVESLHDGDPFSSKEVVMRIQAHYSSFGLYETAILGILAFAKVRVKCVLDLIQNLGYASIDLSCQISPDDREVVDECIARSRSEPLEAQDFVLYFGICDDVLRLPGEPLGITGRQDDRWPM